MSSEVVDVCIRSVSVDKKRRCHIDEDAFCTVNVTSKLLLQWQSSLNDGNSTSLVSQLNNCIKEKVIQVNEARAERLEGRLRRKAGEIKSELRKRNVNRTNILKRVAGFMIKENEVLAVDDIESKYRYRNNNKKS